ncbi:MAG TPA: carbohydrate ABC transporter permease [Candidatus Merdenecus merdavium]|nr:carbohydrate ABC transporter permease [Candidatus Merdenecus merdavium]
MKRNVSIQNLLIHLILIIYCIVVLAPLIIVLSGSLRHVGNNQNFLNLFTQFSLESYQVAFQRMNFWQAFLNSVMTTGGSLIIIVIIGSAAAYPISRIKSKLSRFLYYFFIAGLVIPAQMTIIPVTQMISTLNIPNTRFTPMLMFITCSLPFTTFLYTGFLKGVPVEVEEAAYIDGANLCKRFFNIVFPLLKPATVSVIITQGIWIWNDYFFPMVFVSKTKQYSLPVALLQFLGDKENPAQWTVLFAACILCALPLIILFGIFQKQFVNGVAAGAVKG